MTLSTRRTNKLKNSFRKSKIKKTSSNISNMEKGVNLRMSKDKGSSFWSSKNKFVLNFIFY